MNITFICGFCEKEFSLQRNRTGKFCSSKCQGKLKRQNTITEWKQGKRKGWVGKTKRIASFLRDYLFKKFNNKCSKCFWGEINKVSNKIPLEVNHIDGNAENCNEDNLELLCPNCHSLTPNFRNLNRSSKRTR